MKRRNTPAKQAVLDLLKHTDKALSHDTIEAQIGMEINRATVYRILNQFCEDGLVHTIVAEDGKQYFAACTDCRGKHTPHNHIHFRCTHCDTLVCLPEKVNFSLPEGYRVQEVSCVLTGTCMDCS